MSAQLFAAIEDSNRICTGWCDLEKANTLAAMILAMRPKLIVEIGIFGGRSFIPMAMAAQLIGAKVVGIDPWDRGASLEGMEDAANLEWWSKLDHEQIYQGFMENLRKFGVDKAVTILKQRSDDVDLKDWVIDLLHIDGSHEETAYRDTTRYAARIPVGGIVVCDDVNWVSGAPKRGVEWLLKKGFRQLYALGTGAVFQRARG